MDRVTLGLLMDSNYFGSDEYTDAIADEFVRLMDECGEAAEAPESMDADDEQCFYGYDGRVMDACLSLAIEKVTGKEVKA